MSCSLWQPLLSTKPLILVVSWLENSSHVMWLETAHKLKSPRSDRQKDRAKMKFLLEIGLKI